MCCSYHICLYSVNLVTIIVTNSRTPHPKSQLGQATNERLFLHGDTRDRMQDYLDWRLAAIIQIAPMTATIVARKNR